MDKTKYKRNGTKTSSFGTPGRINHDSTEFYDSKLYEGMKVPERVTLIENPIPSENLDKIYCNLISLTCCIKCLSIQANTSL